MVAFNCFGLNGEGQFQALTKLRREGLYKRFDENVFRLDWQLDDFQAARGDSSPAVEPVAQEGILSLRFADRHFARIGAGDMGQKRAIVDTLQKSLPGAHGVPIRTQL